MAVRRRSRVLTAAESSLWYKDAIIYELHVRSFADSNDDGVGDFPGLTGKLDYLRDLGVNALWLLPFYPSPLRDDGYDISEYTGVHRDYGTLNDFRVFLSEAHKRGLRVITELVLNHTSDQHPWFQRAVRAPAGSSARNYYVWSDTTDRYRDARVIFQDFESSNWTWHPTAQAYYWHRFYSHQPDLNYSNPAVLKAMSKVIDFWLGLGVDGVRLDAVPYLAEEEGTSCENLPATHAILKQLRRYVDQRFADRMLLAEANQWPEDAVAYFGDGDECHMAFHFPLMPRLFMSIRQEDRFPLVDIMDQTPAIPDTCQWALFLRNHDELTLEMVTEEERLFMYRVYARNVTARINLGIRRRLAPLLGNHRRRIELMHALLFSLPGTPVLYYGDEIGMGDNIYLGDRNGVRTPMQWNGDRNAGFSQANPQQLNLPLVSDPEYHAQFVHVEAQERNPHSLLWWTRRLIAIRRRHAAFGRGELQFLQPVNRKVLAFLRRYQDDHILVVANLSRFSQYAMLDLREYAGWKPIEMFSQSPFPSIGEEPYPLALGPFSFYWFVLAREEPDRGDGGEREIPDLGVRGAWNEILHGEARDRLEEALSAYIRTSAWFRGHGRRVLSARVDAVIPLPAGKVESYLTLVRMEYSEGEHELYQLPLTFASGQGALHVKQKYPSAIIANLRLARSRVDKEGTVYDAAWDPAVSRALLALLARRAPLNTRAGSLRSVRTAAFAPVKGLAKASDAAIVDHYQESNTVIAFGKEVVLKLFRHIDGGVNPDFEVTRFLTDRGFTHSPTVIGALEYYRPHQEPVTLALIQRFSRSDGTAWDRSLVELERYLSSEIALTENAPTVSLSPESLLAELDRDLPSLAQMMLGDFLTEMSLLGRRTAEMHLALATETDDPDFRPEPFSSLYRRSVYQSARGLVLTVLSKLREQQQLLASDVAEDALSVLQMEKSMLSFLRGFLDPFPVSRIRHHGNYHLQQVLCANSDFVIIDFEGEPRRPLPERQLKRSPLRDVASMMQSFHYAVQVGLVQQDSSAGIRGAELSTAEGWGRYWQWAVSITFLKSYLAEIADKGLLPRPGPELSALLSLHMLERAVYELGYELDARPDWVRIPMRALLGDLAPGRKAS